MRTCVEDGAVSRHDGASNSRGGRKANRILVIDENHSIARDEGIGRHRSSTKRACERNRRERARPLHRAFL